MAERNPDRRRTHARLLGLAAIPVVAAFVVVGLPAGAQNPPGNNGTIKVDELEFDDHPDNEPHVGCEFEIDFYGYDQGDLSATVTFTGVAPTGGGVLLTDTLSIGEDPAGGGTDLDASSVYDLSAALAGIDPHPRQGHHVRLTVNAEGSQGADVKHKVFWVEGCAPPPSTGTTTTTTGPPPPPPPPPPPGQPGSTTTTTTSTTVPSDDTTTTSTPATSTTTTSTSVPASVTPTSGGGESGGTPGGPPPPTVLEDTSSRPPDSGLAFTGSTTNLVASLAVALLLAGYALHRSLRRRPS